MSYKTLQTDRNFRGNTAEIGKKKSHFESRGKRAAALH